MLIGDVAQTTAVQPATIRFYESEGVIPHPPRSESGYRTYSTENVELIRFVKRARSLGISLNDIKSIVALRNQNEAPCGFVLELINKEARSIQKRIEDLQSLHKELLRLEKLAVDVGDAWPGDSCVCHIVESSI